MNAKSFLQSKTLWANFIAVVLLVLQQVFQIVPADLSPQTQAIILAVLNIILRLVTKKSVYLR